MVIITIGPDVVLKSSLKQRIRKIRVDDKLLLRQDLAKLDGADCYQACEYRGIPTAEQDPNWLREKLKVWLDLSAIHDVPIILLCLANLVIDDRNKTNNSTHYDALPIILRMLSDTRGGLS